MISARTMKIEKVLKAPTVSGKVTIGPLTLEGEFTDVDIDLDAPRLIVNGLDYTECWKAAQVDDTGKDEIAFLGYMISVRYAPGIILEAL